MLQSMTAQEWMELKILRKHELIGYDRQDYQAARIAQVMGGGRVVDYFPPRVTSLEEEQTADEMLEALMGTVIPVWQPSPNSPSKSMPTPEESPKD